MIVNNFNVIDPGTIVYVKFHLDHPFIRAKVAAVTVPEEDTPRYDLLLETSNGFTNRVNHVSSTMIWEHP